MIDLESLFKLSYGMCIISSKKAGKINGCIVNTVFQITPEPPMIAVSVNKKCLTYEYIIDSKVFAVSILSEETPMPLIRNFGFRSGKDINKFEAVNYRTGETGSPIILDNTAGFLEAEVIESIDVVSHTLFIAKVTGCGTLDDTKEPMTYTYYRDIKKGKTPKTAATYIDTKLKTEKKEGAKNMKKYECLICGYIYDPAVGDPDNNIGPGTSFEDLSADWVCPECGAAKEEFEAIED